MKATRRRIEATVVVMRQQVGQSLELMSEIGRSHVERQILAAQSMYSQVREGLEAVGPMLLAAEAEEAAAQVQDQQEGHVWVRKGTECASIF